MTLENCEQGALLYGMLSHCLSILNVLEKEGSHFKIVDSCGVTMDINPGLNGIFKKMLEANVECIKEEIQKL